jgi:hypothetical protein
MTFVISQQTSMYVSNVTPDSTVEFLIDFTVLFPCNYIPSVHTHMGNPRNLEAKNPGKVHSY